MRVVGGEVKGRRLKGVVSPGVRATTGRVRTAIFNIIRGELYHQGRVLDLYAGSGSLGIEALSRGAAWADFVEIDSRQCRVIRSNLEATGFSSSAAVHCSDVEQSLASLTGPFEVVLLDPPYRLQSLDQVLARIDSVPQLVAEGGMVVAGHSRFLELQEQYGSLHILVHRRYGDNVVDFFRRES